MYNLNNLIAPGNIPLSYMTGAFAINNAGQILVGGWQQDYLLTPSNLPTVPPPPLNAVPEPSVLAFIGLAIGALGFRSALRKRNWSAPKSDSSAFSAS